MNENHRTVPHINNKYRPISLKTNLINMYVKFKGWTVTHEME